MLYGREYAGGSRMDAAIDYADFHYDDVDSACLALGCEPTVESMWEEILALGDVNVQLYVYNRLVDLYLEGKVGDDGSI